MSSKQLKPDEITASNLSLKAIQWRRMGPSHKRDKLFLEICEQYMPKIKGYLIHVKQCDRDNFIQTYRIEVFKALQVWEMKSNFETFLYFFIRSVYRQFMNDIKIFKEGISCSTFADMFEQEINI